MNHYFMTDAIHTTHINNSQWAHQESEKEELVGNKIRNNNIRYRLQILCIYFI